jgi:hypothetical protein
MRHFAFPQQPGHDQDGKVHTYWQLTYWQLVRSVRVGPTVRQQTVAHLGELAHGRARAKALARAITSELEQPELFTAPDDPAEAILVRLNRVCLGRGRTLRRWLG